MKWEYFIYFALPAILLWLLGAYNAWIKEDKKKPTIYTIAGLIVFFMFIVGMWISLERPPLRTMGETRLWYSFFLPVAGLVTYKRWGFKWIMTFSTILSLVFIIINIAKPDIHNKTLMPALQSPWFSPHVIIYMFSYAILGAATIVALYYLVKRKQLEAQENNLLNMADNLVYIGISLITIAMFMGALWAKQAWGHYWSWDPKETWAAATWLCYLIYIHYRLHAKPVAKTAMIMLLVAFISLQMCWWGVNYLPSAQGRSVHVYSKQ